MVKLNKRTLSNSTYLNLTHGIVNSDFQEIPQSIIHFTITVLNKQDATPINELER